MQRIRNYFYTIINLKLIQIINRIYRRFRPINVIASSVNFVSSTGAWQLAQYNAQTFYPSEYRFSFLNHSVQEPHWNDPKQKKLWLYNLHYFDDLSAINGCERKADHASLISLWVDENPVLLGNGWEPYPLSLRIVNWLKWQLAGNQLDKKALESLSLQCHVLAQSLEYHLLGNHLFANAKALLFAGVCLEGKDTHVWLKKGEKILLKGLDEQFLADGANFELSPMYHAILLVDCLDMYNLSQAYPEVMSSALITKLRSLIPKAINWLLAMSHDDGKISFFNDTTHGIAWQNPDILSYANSLGFDIDEPMGLSNLKESGFVSVKQQDCSFIADLAEIGPSYILGHAHADTLSFEWCLRGHRVFVNSGISEYAVSTERLRQRQTPAHNTLTINGLSSSEMWSGFRVARRAHILTRKVEQKEGSIVFSASHDGFKQQGSNCIHQRQFHLKSNQIKIIDTLHGRFNEAIAYFILHPEVCVRLINQQNVALMLGEQSIDYTIEGGVFEQEVVSYHPNFGLALPTTRLKVALMGDRLVSSITW